MFKMLEYNPKNIFKDMQIVNFGWDKLDSAKNMAVDEVLLERAGKEGRFFIRFYDFQKPAVVLAANNPADLIKNRNDGFEITRRKSGGWPIYVDKNALSYSITGPLKTGHDAPIGTVLHKSLGMLLADTIKEMIGEGHEVTLGDMSGIRVDGTPIAGHSHDLRLNHSFLYHGVIVIDKWDCEAIEKALFLREQDVKSIKELPNMSKLIRNRKDRWEIKVDLIDGIISRLPKENLTGISDEQKMQILKEAQVLADSQYKREDWIYKENVKMLRDDETRFCIIHVDGKQDVAKKSG